MRQIAGAVRTRAPWALPLASILLCAPAVFAQTPFFHRWGPRDGLVQYSVSSIVQDARGYVWLGTESGASRFDGRTFESFDAGNGFVNGPVRSIVDGGSAVWLLTDAGECYRVTGGRAERFDAGGRVYALVPNPDGGAPSLLTERALRSASGGAPIPVPFSTMPLGDVRPPSAAAAGAAFLGVGRAVYRFRGGSAGKIAELEDLPEDLFALDRGGLGVVLPHRFVRVDVETGAATTLYAAPEPLRLHCGTVAGERIVLGTAAGALVVLRGGSATLVEKGLPAQAVLALCTDREGNLWEGLDSGGVVLLPQTPFTSFTARDGIGAPEVFYLLADRVRGGVWVGTRNGGVAHILDGAVRAFGEKQGLASNRVRALRQAKDGTIFFGTTEGISALAPDGAKRTYRPACGSSMRFFFEDEDGTMWAGGQEGALVAIRGGEARCVDTSDLGSGTNLTCMARHDGKYWVGTGRGIFLFDGDRRFRGPFAPGASIRDLVADGGGALWAPSLDQGAWRLWRGIWRDYREPAGFDSEVRFVEIARDGKPWFGGNRGIWSYPDPRGSRVSTRSGLASDNVYLIRFDPEGRLWVGTNRGLDIVRRRRVVAHFDTADGLADNEMNANGFAADADGRLWFCTMGGVSRLDAGGTRRRGLAPLVDLRRVEVNDVPVLAAGKLVLPHERNSLRFNFSCQCFRDPARVSYQYQLERFDDGWSRPTSLDWASYPKVPPGAYTFRVRCSAADGSESEVLSMPVEIVPAFWQRWSFRALAALAGLGLLAAAFSLRHRQMRRRTLDLERLVEVRTRELAEAAEEMHRQSITDPLTGARNRRDFEQRIRQELAAAARGAEAGGGHALAFLLIDVDHFKKINDAFGHEAGDGVLRGFAEAIQRVIRESDTLFRWGGDEFLVLARETDAAQVQVLVERLKRAVEGCAAGIEGPRPIVTCSLGYTVYPFSSEKPASYGWTELLSIADQGLYLAKCRGRNAYVGFCPARSAYTDEELGAIRIDPAGAAAEGLVKLVSDVQSLNDEVVKRSPS